LPVFLRKKLTYNVAQKIPYFIKLTIEIYSMIYLGFKHNNPRLKLFSGIYIKQIIGILKSRFFSKKYV
jgi:hypothetical protein